MKNIVCLRRYSSTDSFWSNLFRKKKISGLSVEEVIDKYKGFEGEIIATYPVDKTESVSEKIDELLDEEKSNKIFIAFISDEDQFLDSSVKSCSFLGYDFGTCEDGKTVYSSVFNEILFGCVPELVNFKISLNENFLFSTKSLALKYCSLHRELLLNGKDVEHDEDMKVYIIWSAISRY